MICCQFMTLCPWTKHLKFTVNTFFLSCLRMITIAGAGLAAKVGRDDRKGSRHRQSLLSSIQSLTGDET